jgi:hypothetical protein
MVTSEPGTISAAATRKAVELGSPRHVDAAALELGVALDGDGARCAALGNGHLGPEMAQHALGVVAGGLRLDDRGRARCMQPGQQHRRLDLGRGHRGGIFDGEKVGCAADGQGQRLPACFLHLQPHLPQRLEHAAHGPARKRCVADEPSPHVVTGDQAHHQA